MLAAIKGAIMAINSTAISVVTLPLRVLKRLVSGVPSGGSRKGRKGPRRRAA